MKVVEINKDELKDLPKEKWGEFISKKIANVIKEKIEKNDFYAKINASVDHDRERSYQIESNNEETLLALLTELVFRTIDETSFKLDDFIHVLKDSEQDWFKQVNKQK